MLDKYFKEFEPIKCPYCQSHNLIKKPVLYVGIQVVQYNVICSKCNNLLGQWANGLFNPSFRKHLNNLFQWDSLMLNIIEQPINLEDYSEEQKQEIKVKFKEIKSKLLDSSYEMTYEDQRIIIQHCRIFRTEQFILHEKNKAKKDKEEKEVSKTRVKKELTKILSKQEYKTLMLKGLDEDLTSEEQKAINLYQEKLIAKIK